jgi:hypothetical protein
LLLPLYWDYRQMGWIVLAPGMQRVETRSRPEGILMIFVSASADFRRGDGFL